MRITDIQTHIRLALLDLGRTPHVELPRNREALKAQLQMLRIEQANSPTSKMRGDLKTKLLAGGHDGKG